MFSESIVDCWLQERDSQNSTWVPAREEKKSLEIPAFSYFDIFDSELRK